MHIGLGNGADAMTDQTELTRLKADAAWEAARVAERAAWGLLGQARAVAERATAMAAWEASRDASWEAYAARAKAREAAWAAAREAEGEK